MVLLPVHPYYAIVPTYTHIKNTRLRVTYVMPFHISTSYKQDHFNGGNVDLPNEDDIKQ